MFHRQNDRIYSPDKTTKIDLPNACVCFYSSFQINKNVIANTRKEFKVITLETSIVQTAEDRLWLILHTTPFSHRFHRNLYVAFKCLNRWQLYFHNWTIWRTRFNIIHCFKEAHIWVTKEGETNEDSVEKWIGLERNIEKLGKEIKARKGKVKAEGGWETKIWKKYFRLNVNRSFSNSITY